MTYRDRMWIANSEYHIDGIMYDYSMKYDKCINESCILRLQSKAQAVH